MAGTGIEGKGATVTTESKLEYDESVIGVEQEVGSFDVTAEQIAAYCEAVGEKSPLYIDEAAAKAGPHGGIIAPPGLVHTVSVGRGLNANVKFGNTGFHAGERLESIAPMRPGDHITATSQVKEVYEKTGRTGSMVFEVTRTVFRNQHGEEVVATEKSFVRREVKRD